MNLKVQMNGMEDVLELLDGITDTQKLEKAMGKACLLVERDAKKKAPRDTGELTRSITSEVRTEGNQVTGTVFTPLYYAPYIEYGTGLFAEDGGGRKDVPWHYQDDNGEWHTTSGQHPQPFMRPALDENRENILRLLKEAATND